MVTNQNESKMLSIKSTRKNFLNQQRILLSGQQMLQTANDKWRLIDGAKQLMWIPNPRKMLWNLLAKTVPRSWFVGVTGKWRPGSVGLTRLISGWWPHWGSVPRWLWDWGPAKGASGRPASSTTAAAADRAGWHWSRSTCVRWASSAAGHSGCACPGRRAAPFSPTWLRRPIPASSRSPHAFHFSLSSDLALFPRAHLCTCTWRMRACACVSVCVFAFPGYFHTWSAMLAQLRSASMICVYQLRRGQFYDRLDAHGVSALVCLLRKINLIERPCRGVFFLIAYDQCDRDCDCKINHLRLQWNTRKERCPFAITHSPDSTQFNSSLGLLC